MSKATKKLARSVWACWNRLRCTMQCACWLPVVSLLLCQCLLMPAQQDAPAFACWPACMLCTASGSCFRACNPCSSSVDLCRSFPYNIHKDSQSQYHKGPVCIGVEPTTMCCNQPVFLLPSNACQYLLLNFILRPYSQTGLMFNMKPHRRSIGCTAERHARYLLLLQYRQNSFLFFARLAQGLHVI